MSTVPTPKHVEDEPFGDYNEDPDIYTEDARSKEGTGVDFVLHDPRTSMIGNILRHTVLAKRSGLSTLPITMFLPVDSGFVVGNFNATMSMKMVMHSTPFQRDLLMRLCSYYVVVGRIPPKRIRKKKELQVRTLYRDKSLHLRQWPDDRVTVDDANVIDVVEVSNGWIYLIDRLLEPQVFDNVPTLQEWIDQSPEISWTARSLASLPVPMPIPNLGPVTVLLTPNRNWTFRGNPIPPCALYSMLGPNYRRLASSHRNLAMMNHVVPRLRTNRGRRKNAMQLVKASIEARDALMEMKSTARTALQETNFDTSTLPEDVTDPAAQQDEIAEFFQTATESMVLPGLWDLTRLKEVEAVRNMAGALLPIATDEAGNVTIDGVAIVTPDIHVQSGIVHYMETFLRIVDDVPLEYILASCAQQALDNRPLVELTLSDRFATLVAANPDLAFSLVT